MRVNLLPWREAKARNKKTCQTVIIFIIFLFCLLLMVFYRFFLLHEVKGLREQISYVSHNIDQLNMPTNAFFGHNKADGLFNLLCQVLADNRVFLLALKSIHDFLPEKPRVLRLLKSGNNVVMVIDRGGDWLTGYKEKLLQTGFFKNVDVGFLGEKKGSYLVGVVNMTLRLAND